jgi:hypothetical protein
MLTFKRTKSNLYAASDVDYPISCEILPNYLAEELHTGIKDSKMLAFEGGHLFFLMGERQQFLDAVAEFVQ